MQRNQTKGLHFCVSRNSVSTWFINTHACEGANLVRMAVSIIQMGGIETFFPLEHISV